MLPSTVSSSSPHSALAPHLCNTLSRGLICNSGLPKTKLLALNAGPVQRRHYPYSRHPGLKPQAVSHPPLPVCGAQTGLSYTATTSPLKQGQSPTFGSVGLNRGTAKTARAAPQVLSKPPSCKPRRLSHSAAERAGRRPRSPGASSRSAVRSPTPAEQTPGRPPSPDRCSSARTSLTAFEKPSRHWAGAGRWSTRTEGPSWRAPRHPASASPHGHRGAGQPAARGLRDSRRHHLPAPRKPQSAAGAMGGAAAAPPSPGPPAPAPRLPRKTVL